MLDFNNPYIKKLDLNLLSFDLCLFDLDYFKAEFLSVSHNAKFECDLTYHIHILSTEGRLIADVITFVYPNKNVLNSCITDLFNKICSKDLNRILDSSKMFFLHIGRKPLKHLDFEIYHLNRYYK